MNLSRISLHCRAEASAGTESDSEKGLDRMEGEESKGVPGENASRLTPFLLRGRPEKLTTRTVTDNPVPRKTWSVRYYFSFEPGGDPIQKSDVSRPVKGANNIGEQGCKLLDGFPLGTTWERFVSEGGTLSRPLNVVPGINAVTGLHDVFQISLELYGSASARSIWNVPGMISAAAITYGALLDGVSGNVVRIDRAQRTKHAH